MSEKNETGWWELTIDGISDLNYSDREHIAEQIKNGFTSGEVVHEEEQVVIL